VYCEKAIARRRIKASERLGWDVQPHSIADVESAKTHFTSIWDPDQGKFVRKLDEREVRWVRNERAMCHCSFSYFVTRYATIRDWNSKLSIFKPNVAQMVVMKMWADTEELDRAICMVQLKARQLGVSTLCELAVAHRTQFHPNVNGVISSADPEKSSKMSKMVDTVFENEPSWLLGRLRRVGKEIEFPDIKSAVSVEHGSQFNGIARGTTPNVAHLSEIADFVDPEELIDASLLRAMHETPETFLMLESTAAGRHNYFHRTWEFSVANYHLGRSRLQPCFLPWYVATDLYPSPAWLRARPIPKDWRPMDSTLAHADRANAYVKNTPLLKKYLGEKWVMSESQKWFYEVERAEHAAKKELAKFFQEMPGDAMECFQSTNISAFDIDVVESYRTNIRQPLGIYGIIGSQAEIPLKIQPSERQFDTSKPRIKVNAKWSESQRPNSYELVPLSMNGYYSNMDFSNKLFIWEHPEDGSTYGLGVDTGDGVGLDRSVIEVVRKGTVDRNDHQCAEWASAYVNAFDLWPLCMAIGTYFSVNAGDGRKRQAKQVIETNRNGEAVQLELKKRGWKNFHQWIRYDRKKQVESQSQILGWRTVSWSRTLVMDNLLKFLKDGWIDIDSPWFVDEMSDLERDESRQSLKAAYGGNDDRIMALGIVLFSLHIQEVRGHEKNVAVERAAHKEAGFSYPKYDPGFQGRDFDQKDFELPVHQFLREYGDI
jgi:hypothetical protein